MVEKQIEKQVVLPEGVTGEVQGREVSLKGFGQESQRKFKAHNVSFKQENGNIAVIGNPGSRKMNAIVTTIASHINNMAKGLETEYVYKLTMVYSHFPMNVAIKGNVVEINNFTGEKKTRIAKIMQGATVTIKGKDVVVKSHNKETAGQTAANLESATKVKGKDKRIFQDGIFIVEKAVQEKKEEGK